MRALQRGGLGQHDHAGLARRHGPGQRPADSRQRRADVDDAAAVLAHGLNGMLDAEEGAIEVHAHHPPPVLERGVDDWSAKGHAGVVDKHVEATMRLDDRGNGPLPVVLARHVQLYGVGDAAGAADLLRRSLCGLEIDVGKGDDAALVGHRFSDRPPDAAAGTRDETHLARQAAPACLVLLLGSLPLRLPAIFVDCPSLARAECDTQGGAPYYPDRDSILHRWYRHTRCHARRSSPLPPSS